MPDSTSIAKTDSPPSEVYQECTHLSSFIEKLNGQALTLRDRLEGILKPGSEEKAPVEPPPDPSSPFASSLRDKVNCLQEVHAKLNDIIERLAL